MISQAVAATKGRSRLVRPSLRCLPADHSTHQLLSKPESRLLVVFSSGHCSGLSAGVDGCMRVDFTLACLVGEALPQTSVLLTTSPKTSKAFASRVGPTEGCPDLEALGAIGYVKKGPF